jgi:glycosyltransferase involved in cell wall biosynthesis
MRRHEIEEHKNMRILTNFMNAPAEMEIAPGVGVTIARAETWREFRQQLPDSDVAVIDCRDSLFHRACVHALAFPWARKPLVAVDLVLRRPDRLRSRVAALVKRVLFSRVDHYIHFFRDVSEYTRHFGIPSERGSYVPFKVNNPDIKLPATDFGEDYIIAVGRSLRDYDTYIRAIQGLPYPAVLSEYCFSDFEGKDASFHWTPQSVPPNLRIVPDSGGREEFVRYMAKARIVVIPTQASSICASGISSYLDAMYLGKCVIISHGPGASDLLTDQALLVPPNDVEALREAIRTAWENDELRKRIAENGRRYASSLGGEQELLHRIFRRSLEAVFGTASSPGPALSR